MGVKFSLVIPVAPERNVEILNSIRELDYPKSDFKVIIVKGRNPSENRNRGADNSSGEIIVFLDDDAVIEKNYLKKVEKFFNEHKEIDIVGGIQLTPLNERGFAKISGYALGSKFGAWKAANRYSGKKIILNADETMITSANLICRRKVLEKVKFDPNLFPGEDPKFISDAKKAGFKVAYNPEIIIYHRRRPRIRELCKQIFNYGKVRPLKEKFLETLKQPFFLIPSLFLIYLLVIFIKMIMFLTEKAMGLKNVSLEIFSVIFFPLIAYVALAILFALYDSVKNKDYKAIFFLPFIYPLVHISYGAGMIYGYLNKFLKK